MEPAGEHTPEDYVHVSTPDSNPTADPYLPADPATIFPEDRAAPADSEGGITEAPEAPEQYAERGAGSGKFPYLARSFTEELEAPAAAAGGRSEAPEEYVERGFGSGELSGDLADAVVRLECESSAEGGICNVYIVGTAHVSQDSCRQVQEVIRCLKPEVVFLELCPSRVNILTPQNLKVPTVSEMIDMWKKKKSNTFGIMYSYFLAKVADQLEVFPGSEFRVAFEEARSYGAKVVLGDRPVNITLRRTWIKMPLWHRAKFICCMLFQTLFLPSPEDLNKMMKDMDDVDMLTLLVQEMSKSFPTLMETLLVERDLYMSSTLLKVAREHSSVVAVVGKGHVSGIKKHWKQPIELKHLLEIPTRSEGISRKKVLASAGVVAAGVAIALYFNGKR